MPMTYWPETGTRNWYQKTGTRNWYQFLVSMSWALAIMGVDSLGSSGSSTNGWNNATAEQYTHRKPPPFCNFLHRNAWLLCAESIISRTALKLLSSEALFWVQTAAKCRVGGRSQHDQLGSLSVPQTSYSSLYTFCVYPAIAANWNKPLSLISRGRRRRRESGVRGVFDGGQRGLTPRKR